MLILNIQELILPLVRLYPSVLSSHLYAVVVPTVRSKSHWFLIFDVLMWKLCDSLARARGVTCKGSKEHSDSSDGLDGAYRLTEFSIYDAFAILKCRKVASEVQTYRY